MDINVYSNLINVKRSRPSSYSGRSVIVETESDRGRIIFCSAFRRLQQKAQVFPLENNASVRSRLTHSLEVAHTGKYIAQQIIQKMRDEVHDFKNTWMEDNEQAFLNVVECSCLMHDIGNPPFGHFGEAAIRDWFSISGKNALEANLKDNVTNSDRASYLKTEFLDFLTFDGNAQGLRLVGKLQGVDGKSGLNLTYALLGSYLKYACLPQEQGIGTNNYKKPGFFNTEKELVYDMWKNVGINKNKRFPLSYIMEAADDIAYCLSDIEDGIEKGLLTEKIFFDELKSNWENKLKKLPNVNKEYLYNLIGDSEELEVIGKYTAFKTKLINGLVGYAATEYCRRHDEILKGDADGLIRGDCPEQIVLKSIRDVVGKHIFKSRSAEGVELAGYSTIEGLLDKFKKLLLCNREDFYYLVTENDKMIKNKGLDLERRLYNRLSNKSRNAYKNSINTDINNLQEWHLRAHMLVDHISGMTDDFALETYQLLSGIKINA